MTDRLDRLPLAEGWEVVVTDADDENAKWDRRLEEWDAEAEEEYDRTQEEAYQREVEEAKTAEAEAAQERWISDRESAVEEVLDAEDRAPTAEQEEAATRHTTVEVSEEESDALWEKVYESQPDAIRFAERGREVLDAAAQAEEVTAPKAEDRAREEVEAKERQLARTRELREDDDSTCDY